MDRLQPKKTTGKSSPLVNDLRIKRLSWLLIVISVAFAGDRFGGWLLSRLLLKSEFRYSKMYGGQLSKDVLIIGNSRGIHSFYQPAIETEVGVSTLNLSYNGLNVQLADALLDDYTKFNGKPKLVLIEISMLADTSRSVLFNFKPFVRKSANLANLIREQSPNTALACRLSHLYAMNSELFLRTLYHLNRSDQAWIKRSQISGRIRDSIAALKPRKLNVFPENISALKRIIGKADDHDIPVRLVMAPYFPGYLSKISNLHSWIERIESETGREVFNYTNAIQNTAGFADRVHMNKFGSQLFLERMMQDGLFASVHTTELTPQVVFKSAK